MVSDILQFKKEEPESTVVDRLPQVRELVISTDNV
jgi:hypothetical protein